MRHAFTLVALPRKEVLGQPVEIESQINEAMCCGTVTDTRLRADPITVGDDALLIVALASSTWSNLPDVDSSALPKPSTKFTVYRGTRTGLIQVLEVEGTQDCAFTEGALPAKNDKGGPLLDYTCGTTTKHFRFNGTRYR